MPDDLPTPNTHHVNVSLFADFVNLILNLTVSASRTCGLFFFFRDTQTSETHNRIPSNPPHQRLSGVDRTGTTGTTKWSQTSLLAVGRAVQCFLAFRERASRQQTREHTSAKVGSE